MKYSGEVEGFFSMYIEQPRWGSRSIQEFVLEGEIDLGRSKYSQISPKSTEDWHRLPNIDKYYQPVPKISRSCQISPNITKDSEALPSVAKNEYHWTVHIMF